MRTKEKAGLCPAKVGAPAGLGNRRISRGQSGVEFALGATLALVLMVVGVQFAIIGQAALAVSQAASALARYAAVNPGAFATNKTGSVTVKGGSLPTAAQNLLSPTILTSSGGDLTVTVSAVTATGASETGTPVQGQDQVVISLSYDATKKIVLPRSHSLLGISFPTTLTASDSQLYE